MVDVNWGKSYCYMQIDEVGKDDNPDDPGGRTCDGVTQDELNAWCQIHKQPSYDVWTITDPVKQAIFYTNYWQPWCARLPDGIDYLWFDVNVNSGPREATLILQRALGFNKRQTDGRMGVFTAQQALVYPDKAALIDKFCIAHQKFYLELVHERPVDEEFIKGWTNRVNHERANAHEILASARPPAA